MKHNELLVHEPGNQYPSAGDVAPFASLPSWWRRFIFQVLNGRELQVYLYIVMMVDGHAISYPRVETMREDMGLNSDTQIFEALKNLEKLGFIRRRRQRLPNRSYGLPRNIYQRPAPEYTLLTLLKCGRTEENGMVGDKAIDEFLNPSVCPTRLPDDATARTPIHKDVAAGLKRLLGHEEYEEYSLAEDGYKREILLNVLQTRLDERLREGGERYANREKAPRDRQREEASKREKEIIASGGASMPPPPPPPSLSNQIFDDESIEDIIPF